MLHDLPEPTRLNYAKASSRHFKRVVKYARPSDYAQGVATTAFGPALMLLWERVAPSYVGRGGFAPIMRLTTAISLGAGFLVFYQQSARMWACSLLSRVCDLALTRFP